MMRHGRRWWALALILIAPAAAAWNDTGHMIAALIAYDQLPSTAREEASRLLRLHPRFREDFVASLPQNLVKATAAEQDRWYFAYAATWPDVARRFENAPVEARQALIAKYHRGSWHYINLPTYLRTSDRQQIHQDAPSMTWSADLDDAHLNVVQVLQMLTGGWCSMRDADRALALSWILHLIGDLHQPLHTTALFAVPAFTHGDRGGNDILVVGGSNLHALWDGALGDERRLPQVDAQARDLGRATATESAKALQGDLQLNFRSWAKHGRYLASKIVYSPDVRAMLAAASPSQPPRVVVDDRYRDAMSAAAERQIGLAGHRIVWVVEALLRQQSATCTQATQ